MFLGFFLIYYWIANKPLSLDIYLYITSSPLVQYITFYNGILPQKEYIEQTISGSLAKLNQVLSVVYEYNVRQLIVIKTKMAVQKMRGKSW